MRLELGTFPVKDVAFGRCTQYRDGLLEVDRAGLLAALRSDTRLAGVDLVLARPGESVRITALRDIIEPRTKVRGTGTVYPGVCGRPVNTVGTGRTHCLSGVGVVEVAAVRPHEGLTGNAWAYMDMSGPGAESIPEAALINLCVVMQVDSSLHVEDQNAAVHSAALLVADRLAEAVRDAEPPEMETFELSNVDPSLPKIAYIMCLGSPEHYSGSLTAFGTAIYGLTRLTPPWVLHPNELLDGAINSRASWTHVNNPVVLELYRSHGKSLCFVGCVAIRTRWSSQAEKDVTSRQAAKMAKMLGADGAIITWDSGGNDFMEVIRTVQACEQIGVKAVLMTLEESPDSGGPPLLEPLPEADAIISTGVGGANTAVSAMMGRGDMLPPVQKVIGISELPLTDDPHAARVTVPASGPVPASRGSDRYGFFRRSGFSY
ncbi:MAG: glycine/sarcosine/betaine reductase component B subunit [Chloroflexota bacterium]|nr:glycine/sarcosine/betaine reductase component B subunit [Chloroflexota bacterium]